MHGRGASSLTLIWALGLALLGQGCDDAVEESDFSADYGIGGGKQLCLVDDDCDRGEVCFAGECIFQGSEPPPPPAGEPDVLPEEREESIAAYSHPAAGVEHVFVARPAADSVVRIHGETLALDAIEVGDEPTVVRVIPGTDRAVVLNRGSDELTIIDADGEPSFALLDGQFNALTLTPDGRHALCWFDLAIAREGELLGSFQDMVVVDLDDRDQHAVTVGFRPRRVQFTADGATALVITDDGISYFRPADLGETTLADTVPVAPDVFRQDDREVAVTGDGRWAISRGPDEGGVTLVKLSEGVPRFIALAGQPTDIDVLPDDSAALVMIRGARQAVVVPFEAAHEDPTAVHVVAFPDHVLGSAAVGDAFAVLYTTQTETRAQITLLDLATLRMVHRPIRKAVAGVELSPDGRKAIIVHAVPEGAPAPDPDAPPDVDTDFILNSHGYSLLDIRTTRVKLQTTQAPPSGLVFAPERDEAYLVLRGDDVAAVHRIDLEGFSVQSWDLGTPPEVIGVLSSIERAFVTQTHPEGRISFIRLDADPGDGGRLETVSGYALNGRID